MNRNYWTKEKCIEEALKYTSRSEFQKKSKGSYVACYKNGWLDIVCEHMSKIRHEKGYWTKERCLEEALKYKNIKEMFEEIKNMLKNEPKEVIYGYLFLLGGYTLFYYLLLIFGE